MNGVPLDTDGRHRVEAAAAPATAWRNGGGVTRELLRLPAARTDASDAWDLRISLADVEHDGPFSAYPGIQRWIAVVAGAGMRLEDAGATRPIELRPGAAPLRFDGAWAPQCVLLDGPIRDLNVMAREGARRAVLQAAAWHSPWSPAGMGANPARGVFVRQAARLVGSGGAIERLPAFTLAFWELSDITAWTLLPEGGSPEPRGQTDAAQAPPGWWIACTCAIPEEDA